MRAGILLLGFGEPEAATLESVASFLERVFLANARLESTTAGDTMRRRARALAERRAPELVEEYRRIGGSPLNEQAARQAGMLEAELARRGYEAVLVLAGMQFTDPSIAAVVDRARHEGVERLVALPTYPLPGPSTTMPALQELREAVAALEWSVPIDEVTGWHAHPRYTSLWADCVRALCGRDGLDLSDPQTHLVFCAHGTPLQYLDEGSRYDLYVADHCRRLAAALGVERYVLGFQNHANRPGVAWTEPEIGQAIQGLEARRIVVVPVSFMQEHSETLAELDIGLKGTAEELGLDFHRVPVPHADPGFIALLGDLVTPLLGGVASGGPAYGPCRCRVSPGAVCLNHELERPPAQEAVEEPWRPARRGLARVQTRQDDEA